jgi:hypothetical protein
MTILNIYSNVILLTIGEEEKTKYFMLEGIHLYHKNVAEQKLHYIFSYYHISRRTEYYASSLDFNVCNFFL